MNTSHRLTRLVDDLAGQWTEPVLEMLQAAGKTQRSVQTEIDAWQYLSVALRHELSKQGGSFTAVKEKVLTRALLALVRKYSLYLAPHDLEAGMQEWIHDRRSSAAERKLFGQLTPEPAAHAARHTDFMQRLQLTAAGV
jgi:hypothetical protein